MRVYSVSDVNKYIKGLLGADNALRGIMISGELSNFKCYPSGHCYFTLKDASSALKCVMFKSRAQYLRFNPTNGLKVIAGGSISVYERDGAYQLYVDTLVPEGKGELALAFEQLKERLTAEGLFSPEHKQPLPRYPQKIGIVTSRAGAVLRDIYHVSKRRWPSIELQLAPVQVQGTEAAGQIAAAIDFFNQKCPVDVLIVGRGGGSMEDLWAFNEEIVVRAIFASRIPVISAVGHETDFTLADFVADVRAATPSQAAELAVPDRAELLRYVASLEARVQSATEKELASLRARLTAVLKSPVLARPQEMLASRRDALTEKLARLQNARERLTVDRAHRLDIALERLELLSPVRTLRRGYTLLTKEGRGVASSASLAPGDRVELTLCDGTASALVQDVASQKG